tara:strand:- start:85 stop:408 length:324 start_codon:yes stop_codon:yes gene_type:complete
MELKLDSKFVSRNLRLVISEWYAWLSDKAMKQEEWSAVPNWCKSIPARMDVDWALTDLEAHTEHRNMIQALFVVVDEIYLNCETMENVPDMSKLRGELLRWHEANYG